VRQARRRSGADSTAQQPTPAPEDTTMDDASGRSEISTEPFLRADQFTIERFLEMLEPQQQ
jgi:hypothetical protein